MWKNAMERLSLYRGSGTSVELLERDMGEEDVVSLGELYGNVTRLIGFKSHLNAGKTMALAAFGDPSRFSDVPLVERLPGGRLRCPLRNEYERSSEELRRHFAEHGHPLPPQRDPATTPISNLWEDLAAAVQSQLEAGLIHKVRHWARRTGLQSLCLAGGVALNCVANRRLLDQVPLDRIFVQPNAGDQGQSLGNALYGWHHILGRREPVEIPLVYLGGEYDDEACLGTIEEWGSRLAYRREEDIAGKIARLLAEGEIVGWFRGRSEWGPRALGNRSILADPRRAEMRDRVNRQVKHREPFRPFAPVVPWEEAQRFFELDAPCPTMTVAARVRPDARALIPAVVHVDGTARVQTVTAAENLYLHALLHRFGEITGVSVLLNTSFNNDGEPIVETPADALRCFDRTGLNALALNDFLVMHRS
jgi:carbamoyltransferase